MKKNRKRLMAAFMAVLMVLTLVPTWLLGGIFATTAKADDDVTLGYTFKEADLSKDKSSSSAEIKDGDGIVYEVTAVKGKGEEFSIAGNTLKLKGDNNDKCDVYKDWFETEEAANQFIKDAKEA